MQVWMILGLVSLGAFVAYACIVAAGRSDEQAKHMFEEWQRAHPTNKSEDEPQQETQSEDEDVPQDKDMPQDKDVPDGR